MESITNLIIDGGCGKDGRPEPVRTVEISPGEVVAVVGATGSGKTRLLADVERLSQGDSPTGRVVRLVTSGRPSAADEGRVARISQSMGYFLDASVIEMLRLHARFRAAADVETVCSRALEWANRICGEGFGGDTPLAHLSGGQARALMVADTVVIANSPVVLVDEIENAGIDRELALDFLLQAGTIGIVATHDPLIALRARRRLVMAGGAVVAVVSRTDGEVVVMDGLRRRRAETDQLRQALREGRTLHP